MSTVWRILKYLWPYRWRVIAGVALSLVLGVLSFASTLAFLPIFKLILSPGESLEESINIRAERLQWLNGPLKDFVRTHLPADRFKVLLVACGVLFALVLVKSVLTFLQCYLAGYVQHKAARDLRNDLHRRVMRMHLGFFQSMGIGAIMSRFTADVNVIAAGLKSILEKLVREPILLAAMLAGCLMINPILTVCFLVIFPVIGGVIVVFSNIIRRYTKKTLKVRATLLRMLEEVFRGIRVVKAMLMEKFEAKRFAAETDRLFRRNMRIVVADSATSPSLEIILTAGMCLALGVGGYFVLKTPNNDASELLIFYIAMGKCVDPLRKLSKVFKRIQPMRAAGERVFDFMDHPVEIRVSADAKDIPPIREQLEFRDVYFSYTGNEEALTGVSLVARKGQTVAIVGPSGSGKSTIINLIPRFYDPSDGAILIDGVDIRTATLESLRGQISLVSQETILFSDTVANNIAYSNPDAPREQIIEAAKKARAHDFIMQQSDGYDTRIGAGGVELSGGERQRIALARAILRDPALLLLDEPTSSLDSYNESLIQEALDEFCRDRTTFVVAHRLSTVRNADVIIVLADGRVEATGSHAELMETSPTYKRLHMIQFQAMDESG